MTTTRRANHEGSVRLRPDGRFEARVTFNGIRRSYFGKSRKEAVDKMRAALKRPGGPPPVESRERLDRYLESWLEIIRPTTTPKTWTNDAARIRNHITPAIGRLRLRELTPADVENLLALKLRQGLAPQTVIHLRGVLRRALKRAQKLGMVDTNAAALADPPKLVRVKEPQPLDAESARQFLELIRGEPLEAFWVTALTTAMRTSELLGLRWQDVDLEERVYRVTGTLQRVEGQLVRVPRAKTRASLAAGALSSLAVTALQEHRQRQLAAGIRPLPQAYVFTNAEGRAIGHENLGRSWRRMLRRLGLPPRRIHDLRHSMGALMLTNGEHVRVVMEVLRHSQIALTMNTYTQVAPALTRAAVDRLDDLLGGGAGLSAGPDENGKPDL